MSRHTVLRVYCGQCAAERRRDRGQLGRVERDGHYLKWYVDDPRRRRRDKDSPTLSELSAANPDQSAAWTGIAAKFGDKLVSEARLAAINLSSPTNTQVRPPETLFAYCPRHGLGIVSSSDVLNRSGSVVLNLIAPA